MESTREQFRKIAENHGLLFLGVVPVGRDETDFRRFKDWLDDGFSAGMEYLKRYLEVREDPAKLLPGAKSAVVLGKNYFQGHEKKKNHKPKIAQYARLKDYHKSMRKQVLRFSEGIENHLPPKTVSRILVDTAPLLERAIAAKTDSGFVGKNTMFISNEHGSFLTIAELLLTCEIEYDESKIANACGSCRRCQVHCPTGALVDDFKLDANKCLAYWTIEHRGPIPEKFWPFLKFYYFGCDICQLVCPHNRNRQTTDEAPRVDADLDLFDVATMDQEFYEATFGGTPLTRAKKSGLQRNALIAMAVTGDDRLTVATSRARGSCQELDETLAQVERWQSSCNTRIT